MSRVVRPSALVIEYARRLAPEPRRAIKHALAELREERGDICALEANLSGYYRLRVGRHRILFNYAVDGAIWFTNFSRPNLSNGSSPDLGTPAPSFLLACSSAAGRASPAIAMR